MKTVLKSHTLAIGLAGLFAILFIVFGLVLSGALYLIIGRNASKALSEVSSGD